jgi:hypothetical protein
MKRSLKPLIINFFLVALIALNSCKKESSSSSSAEAAAIASVVNATKSVAVTVTSDGDTVYVVGTCGAKSHLESIAASVMPATAASYLTTNYAGYTFTKAFKVADTASTLQGYVVIINYNGNPVGLTFDANGAFVKVLEQREGKDLLGGRGYHQGGRFEHRDGKQRDTVAISALPAAVTAYFAANYSGDTLVRASKTKDGGYIVLSKNVTLSATVFNASGDFVSRVALPVPPQKGKATAIDAAALPATATSYLTATYPGYVFTKAFSISVNGVVQGYCVVIEANSTRYGLLFDANGNFVAVKTIR